MAAGELNNDEPPPAPLPAHERGWRHPSEVGHQAWATSEPPIIIGRGLTATTGAISTMIALAVLWMTMPTEAGRGAVVSVHSTLAAGESLAIPISLQSPRETASASTLVSGTVAASIVVSNTVVASTFVPTSTTATPTTETPQPVATYDVPQTKTLADGAVAIAITGSSLVITTAFAVSADHAVELLLTDGSTEMAQVLFVDQDTGLAVLATHSIPQQVAFKIAEIAPGDELTLVGATTYTLTVGADGGFEEELLYDESVREGTPVMNQDGDLVGLCSGKNHIVALGDLEVLLRAFASWAGLRPGDIIVAIGGAPVTDSAMFVRALSGLMPGDSVALSVRYADGAEATLVVELGRQTTQS